MVSSIWSGITEEEIRNLINDSWKQMLPPQQNLWEAIKIDPIKWSQEPYGNLGGGFWVVALIGNTAIWYNDIEEGFNRSRFSVFGIIDEYWCNQDQLEWTVQHILNEIQEGHPSGGNFGPPKPVT